MTRPLSDVVTRDRYDPFNGPQPEYRRGWNHAMDHVARECLPPAAPSPVIAGLIELRDAAPVVRPHDWPGLAELELADLDDQFDFGGES